MTEDQETATKELIDSLDKDVTTHIALGERIAQTIKAINDAVMAPVICEHPNAKESREHDASGNLVSFSAHCEDCGETWPKFKDE